MIEAIFAWLFQLYDQLASATHVAPWVYGLVLAGGVASAISPCYVPILALFGSYVGGYAHGQKSAGLALAIPFIYGNALTLALVGALAALLGSTALHVFTGYQLDRSVPGLISNPPDGFPMPLCTSPVREPKTERPFRNYSDGVDIIGLVMGLQLLGVLNLKLPKVPTVGWAKPPNTAVSAFGLGLPFGLVITPWTIPIVFAIVALVAMQASILHGAFLMVTYALGRGVVLLAVASFAGLLKALNVGRTAWYIERVSGVLILLISLGLLLFHDAYVWFTGQWMPVAQ
jgi:cytochrome c-type biogenesis protein